MATDAALNLKKGDSMSKVGKSARPIARGLEQSTSAKTGKAKDAGKSEATPVVNAKTQLKTDPDEVTLDGQTSLSQLSSLSGRPAVGNVHAIKGGGSGVMASEFTIDNLTHSLPKISKALKFDSARSKMVAKGILDNVGPKWAQLFPTAGHISTAGGTPKVEIPAAQSGKGFIFNGHPLKMVADAVGANFKPGDAIDEAAVRELTTSVLKAVRKYPDAKTTVDAILGQAMWWAEADTQVRGGRDFAKNYGEGGRLAEGLSPEERAQDPVAPMAEFADYAEWIREVVLGVPEDKERIYSNHPIVLMDPFSPEERASMFAEEGKRVDFSYDDGDFMFGYMGYYKLGDADAKTEGALRPFGFGFTNNITEDGQPVYRTMITIDPEAGMVAARYDPSIIDDLQSMETMLGHDNDHFVVNQQWKREGNTLGDHWAKLNGIRWENKVAGRTDIKEEHWPQSVYSHEPLRVANNEYDALLVHVMKTKLAMEDSPELRRSLVDKTVGFEKKVISAATQYAAEMEQNLKAQGKDPSRAGEVKTEIINYFMEAWLSRNVMFVVDPSTIPELDALVKKYPFVAEGKREEKPGPSMYELQKGLYSGTPAFPGSPAHELDSYLKHAHGVAGGGESQAA